MRDLGSANRKESGWRKAGKQKSCRQKGEGQDDVIKLWTQYRAGWLGIADGGHHRIGQLGSGNQEGGLSAGLGCRGERRAHPIFRYTIHDKTYQKESNDDYPVEWIEQNLQPEQSYPVWVDYNGPKGDVRLNRRFGMGPAVLMLLFSAGIAVAIFLAMQNLFQSAM